MTKRIRFLTVFAVCIAVLSCFSVTAFAYADDTEQNLPVTEASQPEDTPAPEKPKQGEPIDDEGNAYTRDLLYDKATNKQFITIQTKNGNTFYIVIDYDAPVNEDEEQYKTYFLNLVDERDLTDLLDEEDIPAVVCTCADKCEAGKVNTSCPVCKNNLSECTGKAAEAEAPSTETDPSEVEQTKKSSNIGMVIGIVAVVGIGGAAYYYIRFVRSKKQQDEDLDFFDDEGYEEEPYINEDEEPQITEDEKTDGDEE